MVSFCRSDFVGRYPEALRELSKLISDGRLVRKYHIVEGLERAPEALPLLYTGANTGKLFVSTLSAASALLVLTRRFQGRPCLRPSRETLNSPRQGCGVIVPLTLTNAYESRYRAIWLECIQDDSVARVIVIFRVCYVIDW